MPGQDSFLEQMANPRLIVWEPRGQLSEICKSGARLAEHQMSVFSLGGQ